MNTTTNDVVVELNEFYRRNRIKIYTEACTLTKTLERRRVISELNQLPYVLNTNLTREDVEQLRHVNPISPVTALSPMIENLRKSFVITSDYYLMRPLYYHDTDDGPQSIIGLPKAHLDWGALPEKYRAKDYKMSHGAMRDLYDQLIKNHKRFSKEA